MLDSLEEALLFFPATIVKDKDRVATLRVPATDFLHELIGLLFGVSEEPVTNGGIAIYFPVQGEQRQRCGVPGDFQPGIVDAFVKIPLDIFSCGRIVVCLIPASKNLIVLIGQMSDRTLPILAILFHLKKVVITFCDDFVWEERCEPLRHIVGDSTRT